MVEYLNHVVLQQFKNWMLPIAMIVGGVFHSFFASLAFLTPYLIFLMLLVPYCKLSLGELRIAPLHVRLLLVQIAGGLGLYLALAPIDPLLAQGTFICVLAPTATSAAVVTGMLGGSVASEYAAQGVYANMAARDGWQAIDAVKNGRVLLLSQQMLDAPYMRLAAMLLIAKTSNPPLFEDVDAASMLTMLAEEATGSIPAGVYYYVGGQ